MFKEVNSEAKKKLKRKNDCKLMQIQVGIIFTSRRFD